MHTVRQYGGSGSARRAWVGTRCADHVGMREDEQLNQREHQRRTVLQVCSSGHTHIHVYARRERVCEGMGGWVSTMSSAYLVLL